MYTQCDKGYIIRSCGIRWDFSSNRWNGIIYRGAATNVYAHNIIMYEYRHSLLGESSSSDGKHQLNRKLFEFLKKTFSQRVATKRRFFWKKSPFLFRTPHRIRFRQEFRTSCQNRRITRISRYLKCIYSYNLFIYIYI